ncbi:VTT domain-containing protein [Pseudalkalibacillus hwajinpoensis]|uniref:DedA family protein n=1 Tax=Guptibacillus hwajinpoensis TaxID=208199 RepID=UPI00325B7BFD
MLEFLISFLKELGIWGLFISNAIEASLLPFPGGMMTLTYGYLLNPSFLEMVGFAFLTSVIYTLFSFIPYGIGLKVKDKVEKKLKKKKVERVQKWFRKCGSWSIAITRPLGVGNYVSYVSGMSKVKPWIFGSLTFIGIFPWTIAMLWIGRNGNIKSVQAIFGSIQKYVFLFIAVAIIGYIGYRYYRKRCKINSERQVVHTDQT